eukprot:3532309-Prymnesium_polylepis.1
MASEATTSSSSLSVSRSAGSGEGTKVPSGDDIMRRASRSRSILTSGGSSCGYPAVLWQTGQIWGSTAFTSYCQGNARQVKAGRERTTSAPFEGISSTCRLCPLAL